MRIFNLFPLFFCWQVIASKESTSFTGELKKLYDSLRERERTVIKNSKKRYPSIPKKAWRKYDILEEKAFNAIKKDYEGYPACDVLDQFSFNNWDSNVLKDFLTAYAKCSLENSDIDPEKVSIIHCSPNNEGNVPKNKCQTDIGFKDNDSLIDFCEDNGTKKKGVLYEPVLHIEPMLYVHKDEFMFQLAMINKAVSSLATSSALKQAVLKHLVLSYYGVEILCEKKLLKSWGPNELCYNDIEHQVYTMFDQNALIISLMQNPELVDYVCNNLEERDTQTNEIKKVLKFLYKIKKLKFL